MPSAVELINFLEHYIKVWGIVIVPLGAFLENSVILGFIFPGVTVIFLSGFAARGADGNLVLIILLATIGSFLGDNLDYFIGSRTGKVLSKKPLFAKPIAAVGPFLHKHGVWAIFAGRFSSASRAWVALASGISKVPYMKFATVSLASALTWTSVWIIGGYLVGGNRGLIEDWLSRAAILFWLGFVILLVYYFRTRIKLIYELILFFGRKYGNAIKNGLNKTRR